MWLACLRNRARMPSFLATLNSHVHAAFLQRAAHLSSQNQHAPATLPQHRDFAVYKAGWYRPPDPFIPSNLSNESLLDQFMRSSAATGHERDTQLIKLFEETQQRAPSLTPRELAQLLEVSGKLSGPKSSMAVRTAARHAAAALVDTLRTWSPEARMDLVNTNTDSINNFARNLIEGLRWTEALTAEQAGQLAEEVLVQIAPTLRNEQLAECLEQLGHMTCQGTLVNTAEFIALLHQRIPHMTLSALAQMCFAVSRFITGVEQHTLLHLLASCVNTQALSSTSSLGAGGPTTKPFTMRRLVLLLVGFAESLGSLPPALTPFAVGRLVEDALPYSDMFYLSQALMVLRAARAWPPNLTVETLSHHFNRLLDSARDVDIAAVLWSMRAVFDREAWLEYPVDVRLAMERFVWANTLEAQLRREQGVAAAATLGRMYGALGHLHVTTYHDEFFKHTMYLMQQIHMWPANAAGRVLVGASYCNYQMPEELVQAIASVPLHKMESTHAEYLSFILYGIANQGHTLEPQFIAGFLQELIRRKTATSLTAVARVASAVCLMFQNDTDALKMLAPLLRTLLYVQRPMGVTTIIEPVAIRLFRMHLMFLARCPEVPPLLTRKEHDTLFPVITACDERRALRVQFVAENLPEDVVHSFSVYTPPREVALKGNPQYAYKTFLPRLAAPSVTSADASLDTWSVSWHDPTTAPAGVVQCPEGVEVPPMYSRTTEGLHCRVVLDVRNTLANLHVFDWVAEPGAHLLPSVSAEVLCEHRGVQFAIEVDTAWTRYFNRRDVVRPPVQLLRLLIEARGMPVVVLSDALWDYAHTAQARAEMVHALVEATVFGQWGGQVADDHVIA